MQKTGIVKYINETKSDGILNKNQPILQSKFVVLKEIKRSLSIRNGKLAFIPGNVLKGLIANLIENYYVFLYMAIVFLKTLKNLEAG